MVLEAAKSAKVVATPVKGQSEILTPEVLAFLVTLHRTFNGTRLELLNARAVRQQDFDSGKMPAFLDATRAIREDPTWRGAAPAPGLVDRRVEITGPVDRKMIINALNSGATQFMADFEDSTSPTWRNCIDGQINLRDAARRTIAFTAPDGREYRLNDTTATLLVRPRGWHLNEEHVLVDGVPLSASIFDFGVYFFTNARQLVAGGAGPYFYLPKMESHREARLWNDIFNVAQDMAGIPRGTIRATVLIETVTAALEMDEILYELRDHSAGLNCGRWDYIYSVIKKFRYSKAAILPDRALVTMTVPFMAAYVRLLVATCHRRGVHAMGGMAAQIPIRGDTAANEQALQKVRADKTREVLAGHDGTWVAHPALIPVAREVFDRHMPQPNQIFDVRADTAVAASDLLNFSVDGEISEAGIRGNVQAALEYTEAYLRGVGCVPINNLMEDAATAEIARSQLWQWVFHQRRTADGTPITADLVARLVDEEVARIRARGGNKFAGDRLDEAKQVTLDIVRRPEFTEFLTLECYPRITTTLAGSAKM